MTDKFKGKYRNESARLQNWDYGRDAPYFITICTKDRVHHFGEIENNKMKLSHQGVIADLLWYEIKNHAKNVILGEFVVMPNHIHGILIIDGNDDANVGTGHALSLPEPINETPIVGTTHALSLPSNALSPPVETTSLPPQPQKTIGQQRYQNQGLNTVSSIIGSYKSAVTKHCNRLGLEFAWQTRFHDHIIRNDASFQRISEYIKNNPANWKDDKFY
ncbi:MAG: transposase [Spirosomataceae bacterium]